MMSNVQRVCVQCGQGNPVEARYCAHCGYDSQGALPAPRTSLPVVIGRAALPVLVGAATVAMRIGWRLLQSRLTQPPASSAINVQAPRPQSVAPQPRADVMQDRRAKRTIRIRSSCAVSNGNGGWQEGTSDHTIEFDD